MTRAAGASPWVSARRVFARRWWLGSVIAGGLASASPGCHEEVSLGAWPDLAGGPLTSGTGGAPSTLTTVAAASTTASGATTSATATDGGPGAGGAAGAPNDPPPLPECLAPATPGPVNAEGVTTPYAFATETATDWNWPKAMTSLEWEIRVERDIPRATPPGSIYPASGYYYSHQFWFLSGISGTLGIQAFGGYNEDPTMPSDEWTKIATFWLSGPPLDAKLGDIPEGDARIGADDAPGAEYVTIHARFDWKVCHTYRFRVAPHSTEPTGEVWYGAWITDVTDGIEILLGRMLLPADIGRLATLSMSRTQPINFRHTTCDVVQYASVLLGTPQADDGALLPLLGTDRAGPGSNRLGDAVCAGSRFSRLDGAMRHELGVPP